MATAQTSVVKSERLNIVAPLILRTKGAMELNTKDATANPMKRPIIVGDHQLIVSIFFLSKRDLRFIYVGEHELCFMRLLIQQNCHDN
jgi:hypothetical protein